MKRVEELTDEEISSCIKSDRRLIDFAPFKMFTIELQSLENGVYQISSTALAEKMKRYHTPLNIISPDMSRTKISEYLIFRDILYNDALQSCEELNKLLR
jgi:hypothetical protein